MPYLIAEAGLPGGGIGILIILIVALVIVGGIVAVFWGSLLLGIGFLIRPAPRVKTELMQGAQGDWIPVTVPLPPPTPAARRRRLIGKIGVAGLLIIVVAVPLSWYIAIQPSRDFKRLKRAGFSVSDLSAEPEPWFRRRFADIEPKLWEAVVEERRGTGKAISPEEFVAILRRHPELKVIGLRSQGSHPEVLKHVVQMPTVTHLSIKSQQPISADWLADLPQQTNWQSLDVRFPEFTPEQLNRLLEHCEQLRTLSVPVSSVNQASCAALIAQPRLHELFLYDRENQIPSEGDLIRQEKRAFRGNSELAEIYYSLKLRFPKRLFPETGDFRVIRPEEFH